MAQSQSVIERTKRHEGNVEHLYLDKPGNVTVGVGIMLPSAAAAGALPLVRGSDAQAATAEEKTSEWTTVSRQEKNRPASFYRQFTSLIMTQPEIDKILIQRLDEAEADLKGIFSGYDSFPVEAREALMDMIFNLGRTGFLRFTVLVNAVRAQEWFLAAAESNRKGIPADRNAEIKALFETAGQKSPNLAGTWVGSGKNSDGDSAGLSVVFNKIGSNSYNGQITVLGEDPFSGPLKSVQLNGNRTIAFSAFIEDTLVSFDGSINAAFKQMGGTLKVDGESGVGSFDLTKR